MRNARRELTARLKLAATFSGALGAHWASGEKARRSVYKSPISFACRCGQVRARFSRSGPAAGRSSGESGETKKKHQKIKGTVAVSRFILRRNESRLFFFRSTLTDSGAARRQ